jgi:caffeoyl-CoA O-methyltransferase
MRNEYQHFEEFGREEGGRSRGQRGDSHYSEDSRRERRGERSGHHGDEEGRGRGEQRERHHHHRSWRGEDEEGIRGERRRGRIERGMLRYLLLAALQDSPKHGYEVIRWLEEQTYGRYTPSAGTVYPTLQLLEDQGLIVAERTGERSVYRLNEVGEVELQTRADFLREFWEQYGNPVPAATTLLASEFVQEELKDLQHTVETGMRVLTQRSGQGDLLPLRQALERSKNEIRDLLTQESVPQPMSIGTPNNVTNARELEEEIARVFVSEDEALQQTLVRARENGLPEIQISALQGKLLQILALACRAQKILEIGALAGYSGIWLARALPVGGQLITLEIDAKHAEVVRESFRQAGVDDRAEVRVGPALETLPQLTDEAPFDLIFIDADKDGYPQYLEWAIKLARPGTLIIADNCVRDGQGLEIEKEDSTRHRGIRMYNKSATRNAALRSIALPINTGMTISVVVDKGE